MEPDCPSCKTAVSLASYYCQNCGKKLREKPLSTSILKQITIYFVSFFIPPTGLFYGFSYIRQESDRAKAVGLVAIILTLVSIMLSMIFVITIVNTMNRLLGGELPKSSVILNQGELEKTLNLGL